MEYSKIAYEPLRQNKDDHSDGDDDSENNGVLVSNLLGKKQYLYLVVIAALVLSNIFLAWRDVSQGSSCSVVSYWGSSEAMTKQLYWATDFSDNNKTNTNPLWRALFPDGDGIVTLADDWAASQQLPTSAKLSNSSNESVYYVSAYHQLHCLTAIRSMLYHLREGRESKVSFEHVTHCLDSLRQSTMCQADDTLLRTDDLLIYGDGQPRTCKDWDALARWTSDHGIKM